MAGRGPGGALAFTHEMTEAVCEGFAKLKLEMHAEARKLIGQRQGDVEVDPFVLDSEILRRNLVEEVPELCDLSVELILIDVFALELDRGLLDHALRSEDWSLCANRERDRV